jgi:hypothetical protein
MSRSHRFKVDAPICSKDKLHRFSKLLHKAILSTITSTRQSSHYLPSTAAIIFVIMKPWFLRGEISSTSKTQSPLPILSERYSKTPSLMPKRFKDRRKQTGAAQSAQCKFYRVFYNVTERTPKDAASKTRPAWRYGRNALEVAVGTGGIDDAATLFSWRFAAAPVGEGEAVMGKPWASKDLG